MSKKLLLFLIIPLIFIACKEGDKPASPFEYNIMDLPRDDGTGVVLTWIHFNASPTKEYQIFRGESEEEMELVTTKLVQTAFEEPSMDPANYIGDQDYYIIIENETEIPTLKLVKATQANKDSIAQIGDKVERLETEIAPPKFDMLQKEYVTGDYFKIMADEKEASKPNFRQIPGKFTEIDEDTYTFEEGENLIQVAVQKTREEIDFLNRKDKIYENVPEYEKFIKKYGIKIVAFVTENRRYCMVSTPFQHVATEGLEKDRTYHYKIVAVGMDGTKAESGIKEVTTVDNIPTPPRINYCLFDSTLNKMYVSWASPDRDIQEYSLYSTTEDDTLAEAGTLIENYNPTWASASYETDMSALDQSFYLTATDEAGNSTSSALFSPEMFQLGDIPLPEDLRLVEPPNDKRGNVLSVQWEPIQIYVEYTVTDVIPPQIHQKKYDFEGRNCYLVQDSETGEQDIICSDKWEQPVDYIAKVLWVQEPIEPEAAEVGNKNLIISYLAAYNRSYIDKVLQNIGFARAKLDDGDWDVDRMEIGKFKFLDIPPKEYELTVQLLSSSGKPFKHPEATVNLTVDATKNEIYSPDIPPYSYELYRFKEGEDKTSAEEIATLSPTSREYRDALDSLHYKYAFNYFLRVNSPTGGFADSPTMGPKKAHSEFFNTNKLTVFALMMLFIGFALFFFNRARKGKKFYIRPIAGIDHVDEALGRATEMGRPALFILGLSTISDIATLAGLTVLGRVVKKAAKYKTRVIVPCYNPIVFLVAQETVKSACIEAGRPDAYKEDDVFFVTQSQFAYAAAVNGIMLREKTATNFYMGMFYAESLLLAETGTRMGAIQIAGTDAVTQIPFFITTCDYTLIGEELYAASAYLSDEPIQVGSLKAQDYGKAVVMFLIVLGIILMSVHQDWIYHLFTIVAE
ncbi:hypothetical protein JXI42_00685 [bacterium]|nr:hypothetical protein [bacterium]